MSQHTAAFARRRKPDDAGACPCRILRNGPITIPARSRRALAWRLGQGIELIGHGDATPFGPSVGEQGGSVVFWRREAGR